MIGAVCVMILLQLFALFGLIALLGGVARIEDRRVMPTQTLHIRLNPDGGFCDNCGELVKGVGVPFVDEATRWWNPPEGYARCQPSRLPLAQSSR